MKCISPPVQSENEDLPPSSNNGMETAFEKLHSFFIWISPALSCLVWLLAKLASLLAMMLEWISDGLIWVSEWLTQLGAPTDEQTTN